MHIPAQTEPVATALDAYLMQYRLVPLLDALTAAGGSVYLVGGGVRDHLIGRTPSAPDLEVHGLTSEEVRTLLERFGTVDEVGKAFGIFRLRSYDVEIALPRSDGTGRHPQVVIDPKLGIVKALARRDLTINALAYCYQTKQLIDPYGGQEDIQLKRLRAVNPDRFAEDPLRFFRVIRFIAWLEFAPDAALNRVCRQMDSTSIAAERIAQEWHLFFLKGVHIGQALTWLREVGLLSLVLPELARLAAVNQPRLYHEEGDAFIHSLLAADYAAAQAYQTDAERLLITVTALVHDLGKQKATYFDGERLRHIGHDTVAAPLVAACLKRFGLSVALVKQVQRLVRYHMMPVALVKSKASDRAYKKLAAAVAPLSLRQLALVSYADQAGKKTAAATPSLLVDSFCAQATKAGVFERAEEAVLTGKDLLPYLPAGPELGKVLQEAYALQLEKGITSKPELIKRLKRCFGRNEAKAFRDK